MIQNLRIPTPEELIKLKKWRLSTFWVCLVGYIGYYLCRKNLSAAVPLIGDAFNYSNAQLGLIALYGEIAYAIGKFINGPAADKIGGKKIFLLGMVGAIIANFLFSMGSNLYYFIGVWCICRYFLSMGWGGLAKMIGHWYEPEKNGTVMGFISLNFQFGGVISTLFAGALVANGASWREVFIYPPIVLTAIMIWSYFASKDSPKDVVPDTNFGHSLDGKIAVVSQEDTNQEHKGKPLEIIKDLLQLPLYRQLLLYSILTTFLRSIFFFWTPKLLVDIGMGTSNAILKSALFPLLGCIGTIFLGWYTDNYAKNGDRAKMMWIMLSGLVASLLTVSLLMTSSNADNNLIVIFIGLCGFFLLGPYSMSSGCLTLDIAGPNAAGSATGMIDGLGYLGGALAVWSAGILSDMLGWSEVFLVLTGCAVLATLCAVMMSKEFQKRAKES
jgi:OPA family glycerol-3-phosphate transporter-like MFS transporter